MPTSDFISELLEIKDLIIEDVKTESDTTQVFFHLQRRDIACPCCGAITNKVHDYRTSIIKDSPFQGRKLLLHYRKRRYHCDSCNKHFYEPFSLLPKHCTITTRLSYLSIHLLRESMNVSQVARQVGISASTIFRKLSCINFPKPQILPQVLSIDEFRGNAGGQKFQAILTDPKKHKVIDILPSRSQHQIESYIREFPNRKDVRYFVIDMNKNYLDIARTYLPNATIVVDKFHVVRYINWALENVRKRVQKELHPSKRKYFKKSRWLLLKHRTALKEENAEALEVILAHSSDLATAYYLKELFYDVMESESRETAQNRLKMFLNAAGMSRLTEFNACLTMLANWGKYILNAFDCNYTNGFTEGSNNKIKVIKRNAYGYRNFKNFRNRILLSMT